MTSLFSWNAVLGLLAVCSIGGVAIFIERLWLMNRSEIDCNRFLVRIRDAVERGAVVDAIGLCDQQEGAISRMIKAGLLRNQSGGDRIEAAMEIAGKVEIAQLEKNAKILSLLAHVAPLIGLLGTVLGFIQAFGEMRMSGLVDISATRLGEAMEYALVTTAAGLVVAIPSLLAYNYLVSRIERFVLDMETSSAQVVELLKENQYSG